MANEQEIRRALDAERRRSDQDPDPKEEGEEGVETAGGEEEQARALRREQGPSRAEIAKKKAAAEAATKAVAAAAAGDPSSLILKALTDPEALLNMLADPSLLFQAFTDPKVLSKLLSDPRLLGRIITNPGILVPLAKILFWVGVAFIIIMAVFFVVFCIEGGVDRAVACLDLVGFGALKGLLNVVLGL